MKANKMTLLAALLAVSALAGCGEKPNPSENPSNPTSNPSVEASDSTSLDANVSVSDPTDFDDGTLDEPVFPNDGKEYTFKDYTVTSPSNWNELTYEDNNDTQIMSFLGGSFFSYDFMYDDDGEIIDGKFTVNYDAACKLEDVTKTYAGDARYSVPEGAEDGFAYKITLRKNLKWDDGTPINASDFVYTMEEQLDPLFKNYRADSFYNGATVIHNAKNYVNQGSVGWYAASDPYSVYSEDLDDKMVFALGGTGDDYGKLGSISYVRDYLEEQLGTNEFTAAQAAAVLVANFPINATAEAIVALEGKTFAEIKADSALKATWDALIGWWQTDPNEELHFFITEYTWPTVSKDALGIFVGDHEYELVVVLDSYLSLLDENGDLTFKAAYNFASLPLVHKAKYEAAKKAPVSGSTVWTSVYNSSVETSASWGPYKLTEFQAGKHYTLERNENFYGYYLDLYRNQYQTTKIDVETIKEYNTAFMKFQAGELNGIGIDVSVATDYKNSERAIYTPDDYVGSMQIQSDKEALKGRESDGVNKTILTYTDFRKAMSLAIDRAEYTSTCTTAQKPGFGIFNSMHYYDVANGGVYRDTDVAKQVLVNTYGIDLNEYNNDLTLAEKAITGYDLDQAKVLVNKAYDEALAAGDIKATDKVVITFGTSEDNESTRRVYNYLSGALKKMVEGTKLDGRLETEFEGSYGSKWVTDFKAGAYDICTGGWTGAAWDPGYFLLAYLSPDYMYSVGWDTSSHMLTYLPKDVVDAEGNPITEPLTMSLMDWYYCLNGATGAAFNWADGAVATETRLGIIAAIEGEILGVYYTVPLSYNFSASLLSYQVDYITEEYNTFMGYGGLRYMTYNYDDAAWAAYVEENDLDYKG